MTALPDQSPYQSYAYAYPHKSAYRAITPGVPLAEAWADQAAEARFLYVHVPYCEMRCGFCNLFTTTRTEVDEHERYLDAVERQVAVVAAELGRGGFALGAIGGGTPTLLQPRQLHRLFDILEGGLGVTFGAMPLSVECSPSTALPERLAVLAERGATRVSIGVQSFLEAEVRASGRPQRTADVERALDAIVDSGVELNLDLIYGQLGQTPESWQISLEAALRWKPEEVFLYPLYVRPLTGLGRKASRWEGLSWDEQRLMLYRQGRDHLLAHGYEQHSMRLFRRGDRGEATAYRCQTDGMVGLGAGARSYTSRLHYATEWGVGHRRVGSILDAFMERSDADFAVADHGFVLTAEELQRRHVIQSLLCREGLDRAWYRARFGADPLEHLPQLHQLVSWQWATLDEGEMRLTNAGLERSDALGPWLTSPAVRERMGGFELT